MDLHNNLQLTILRCYHNDINSLNVNGCTRLKELICIDNYISHIDLTTNQSLSVVSISNNKLKRLDLSNADSLEYLYCNSNDLDYLNIATGTNSNIQYIWADSNPKLTCIQADNPSYSNNNWNILGQFYFDSWASFSSSCAPYHLENYIFIFPNPASNDIHLEVPQNAFFQILSLNGRILNKGSLQIGLNDISIQDISKGTYFINIQFSNQEIFNYKLVKE